MNENLHKVQWGQEASSSQRKSSKYLRPQKCFPELLLTEGIWPADFRTSVRSGPSPKSSWVVHGAKKLAKPLGSLLSFSGAIGWLASVVGGRGLAPNDLGGDQHTSTKGAHEIAIWEALWSILNLHQHHRCLLFAGTQGPMASQHSRIITHHPAISLVPTRQDRSRSFWLLRCLIGLPWLLEINGSWNGRVCWRVVVGIRIAGLPKQRGIV